jgi:NAD+ synthase (glutamine-hydrolysing)
MSFRSIYCHGLRAAACVTCCSLADPAANAAAILTPARECDETSVAVAVFPELGISGYRSPTSFAYSTEQYGIAT